MICALLGKLVYLPDIGYAVSVLFCTCIYPRLLSIGFNRVSYPVLLCSEKFLSIEMDRYLITGEVE